MDNTEQWLMKHAYSTINYRLKPTTQKNLQNFILVIFHLNTFK